MRTINSLILASGLLACGTTYADDLLQWQNNSLTYLWGKNFKVCLLYTSDAADDLLTV